MYHGGASISRTLGSIVPMTMTIRDMTGRSPCYITGVRRERCLLTAPCAKKLSITPLRSGGLAVCNHCPDCAEETTVPYLAVKSANGKMSDLTILRLILSRTRPLPACLEVQHWVSQGKSCHLSGSNTVMSGLKFRQVCENRANANHKGKS